MQIPARLGKNRWYMAGSASGFAIEDNLPASGSGRMEGAWRRLGCGKSQLIEVERREFGCDQIYTVLFVAQTGFGGDGILLRIIQARIVERSLPVHLQISDKS